MANQKHLSKTSREEYLAKVAELDRRGWAQSKIAKECGVSQPQVCHDLKLIRRRYLEGMSEAREAMVEEKLAQYRDVRREAWAAWERSKKRTRKVERTRTVVKQEEGAGKVPDKLGRAKGTKGRAKDAAKAEVTEELRLVKELLATEGRLPANEYLNTILKCLEAERELLGLDEARKVEITKPVDWDDLTRRLAAPDPVEAAIAAELGRLPAPKQEEG